ncbi:hypothetical protein [Dyella flagellata]|uniref:Uncharacterized protein n=1 Tax=Dyella flagellata TaxID=1867833 RepID=A0ABQ5XDL0_9GAMM|nr:hypothetical protein [Dyella flagellata]GLQ89311.1 hypothetical protein GCM10007898_28840 [Dyella flagellata]
MRVQLEGQSLRLRIDEDELARLLDGGSADNRTSLPDGHVEIQQVSLSSRIDWRRESTVWHISLPEADVRALSERLPTRDGLQFSLSTPSGETLQIVFDVDVRDSARKRLHKPSAGDAA